MCADYRRTFQWRYIGIEYLTPVTRDRKVSKALKAYASMVSSADKGGVRIVD